MQQGDVDLVIVAPTASRAAATSRTRSGRTSMALAAYDNEIPLLRGRARVDDRHTALMAS